MTSSNVLKPLDVNNIIMDGSPVRKKARYDNPERWSLTQKQVQLDDVYDYGVALLASDSEGPSDDEEQTKNNIDINKTELCSNENYYHHATNTPESEPSKSDENDTSSNISLEAWDNVILKPSDILSVNESSGFDQFSLLSDEMILHIFHFIPKRNLSQVAPVCSRFYRLTKDESLWARMDVSNRILYRGALGQILSRQVVILRLAKSDIMHPILLPNSRAADTDFRSRLLYLDLSMAHISCDDLVSLFTKCQRLKKLSLEHVKMNSLAMKALSLCKELEVLNLVMAQGLDIDGFIPFLGNCKKLRELNIGWTCLDSKSISYICKHLPTTLDRLNISGCRKLITDENICDLVQSCKGLRELDLSDCTGLTGRAIKYIVLLEDLNFLALSRCYLIPYRALLHLKQIRSLVYLDLHGGYIDYPELKIIQDGLGSHVQINKFKFSSVARPTVGAKRSSIWNLRVRD